MCAGLFNVCARPARRSRWRTVGLATRSLLAFDIRRRTITSPRTNNNRLVLVLSSLLWFLRSALLSLKQRQRQQQQQSPPCLPSFLNSWSPVAASCCFPLSASSSSASSSCASRQPILTWPACTWSSSRCSPADCSCRCNFLKANSKSCGDGAAAAATTIQRAAASTRPVTRRTKNQKEPQRNESKLNYDGRERVWSNGKGATEHKNE